MKKDENIKIGLKLQSFMKERNIKSEELGILISRSKQAIDSYCYGERNIPYEIAEDIARVLKIDCFKLMPNYEDDKTQLKSLNDLKIITSESHPLFVYKLYKYFDIYWNIIQIEASEFLFCYKMLNKHEKGQLHNFSNNLKLGINKLISLSEDNRIYLELCSNKKICDDLFRDLKRFRHDCDVNEFYFNKIANLLKSRSTLDVYSYCTSVCYLATMNTNDWNILITYMLLGNGNHNPRSNAQQELIDKIKSLKSWVFYPKEEPSARRFREASNCSQEIE